MFMSNIPLTLFPKQDRLVFEPPPGASPPPFAPRRSRVPQKHQNLKLMKKLTKLATALVLFCAGGTRVHSESVELLYPLNGWKLEDVGVSFCWKTVGETKSYQLQLSKTDDFTHPIVDTVVDSPYQCDDEASVKNGYQRIDRWTHTPTQLLPAGVYLWRMRSANTTNPEWSQPRSFTVVANSPLKPLDKPLNANSPLFTFDMFGLSSRLDVDWGKYWGYIPDEIRPYVAFNVEGFTKTDSQLDLIGLASKLDKLGIQFTFKTGGPDKPTQCFADLAQLEYCFQNFPHLRGILTGETLWAHGTKAPREAIYYNRLMALCGKYGKLFVEANGNSGKFGWDLLLGNTQADVTNMTARMTQDYIRKYKAYYVPCAKSNIVTSFYEANSALSGARLAGLVQNTGIWHEAWYWPFQEPFLIPSEKGQMRNMPAILWLQTMTIGLQSGATVFAFGGESSVTEWGKYDAPSNAFDRKDIGSDYTALFDMSGNKTPILDEYIIPYIRFVVKQRMAISMEDFKASTKLVIDSSSLSNAKGDPRDYGVYAELYKNTYGIPYWKSYRPDANSPCYDIKVPETTQGQTLKLQLFGKETALNIAEVEVISGGVNIALQGKATQSSTWAGGDASKAIDGNLDGRCSQNAVAHTQTEADPWWMLDLGGNHKIDQIIIYPRTDASRALTRIQGVLITLTDGTGKTVFEYQTPPVKLGKTLENTPFKIIPTNGRYGTLSIVPAGMNIPGLKTVDIKNLQSAEAVNTCFDTLYPPFSTGNAAVFWNANRFYIMNSHENENIPQNYSVALGNSAIKNISGVMLPHSYIIGRLSYDGCGFSFQANTNRTRAGQKNPYTDDRMTVMKLTMNRPTTVQTTPASALVKAEWDEKAKCLDLKIDHRQGAVDVVVTCQKQ